METLAAIVARILGDWPPDNVIEISGLYGVPLVVDVTAPPNRITFATRFPIVYAVPPLWQP